MDEALNLDNILGIDEIENLFEDDDIQETPPENQEEKEKEIEKHEETTEVNVDNLFTEKPESVGSGTEIEEHKEKEDTDSEGEGTSPKNNFYSSIAKALKEEGIFPDLEDELIDSTTTPENFRDLIEEQIKAGIEERQRRIDEALNLGVEPSEIRKYENALNYLDSIKEENITDESDEGEDLRKRLIFQDFINRGYTKERAEREVNKSFNAGTDVDDAKEALQSNKEYFEGAYNSLIEEAKQEEKKLEEKRKNEAIELKKSLLEDKKVFGEIQLDKATRQRVYDNISKPIYKDPDTGELYTAIGKYEKDNHAEFLKNVGLLYTLTDGFKNLDKLVKGKVTKEVKKEDKNIR